MAEITTRVKSWGNSFGIVIPIEVLRSKGIKEGEEVGAVIIKKGNVLRETFGTAKFKKSTAQMMKETDEELYDI